MIKCSTILPQLPHMFDLEGQRRETRKNAETVFWPDRRKWSELLQIKTKMCKFPGRVCLLCLEL